MMKKALKAGINFFIYVLIIGMVIFGLPKFLSWKLDTPYPMAAITSGSMWPALKEGDLVFIEGMRKPKEELSVGDVVVYRNRGGGTFTIHRVTELKERVLVTKGDANFEADAPVSYDDVIGRTLTLKGHFIRLPHLGSITVIASNFNQK